MSAVKFVVRDARRAIHANWHGSFAERAVAALSAEPETIEELELAMERFAAPTESGFFAGFSPGVDDEPYDAGFVAIDLAARLIVCDSSYFAACQSGCVSYHDGNSATDVGVRFHLSDDWRFLSNGIDWQGTADHRRQMRLAGPPLDARVVLYGKPLVEFIGRECFKRFENGELGKKLDEAAAADAVRRIHAAWLTTQRDDLRGQSPREVMLAKQKFINRDLQDRAEQWSMQGRCPPQFDKQSAAYRFGGFGTHEWVCYYYLVRFLLDVCWQDLAKQSAGTANVANQSVGASIGDFLTPEVPRLKALRDEWLDEPNMEFSGHVPREIIDHERSRMPEGVAGHEAMIDCDCPLCQMQAEMPGPVFWHLDGCNMDDEFAFSSYRTLEEWEAHQREWEEFNRRFKEKQSEQERLKVKYPGGGYADPDDVWQSSFSNESLTGESLLMRLFAIGSHLCELTVDLKRPTENRPLIDRLSRDFGNLREVAQSPDIETADALFEPVMQRFCDTLNEVAVERPDLDEKCSDLQRRIYKFLEPPRVPDNFGVDDSDDLGLPF